MGITRRDMAGLTGGAVVGGLLSPVPWKLLDDSAIWSQNWPWNPVPTRGVSTEKPGICTMCGAGCGLIARCVGPNVFGVKPAAANPAGGGALCPPVYGAHQQPYHPRRLRAAIIRGSKTTAAQAVTAIAAEMQKAPFAWLDERPGRLQSLAAARFAAKSRGVFVTVPQVEDRTLAAIESLTNVPAGSLAYDFENAGVIFSVGAPLLDGWGSAGRLANLWANRSTAGKPWFVQAGSRWSRSAQLADTALLIRPGSEAALVAALAGRLSFEQASDKTGLPVDDIRKMVALLHDRGPAIVIGGGEPAQGGLTTATERMIAALNHSLGSIGTAGGVIQRRPSPLAIPIPTPLDEIADGSLKVLIHDASSGTAVIPEGLLRRKLAPGGTLVRLTAFWPEAGSATDIIVPTTTFLEAADDSSGARDASRESWSFMNAILTPPPEAMSPQAFLAALGSELGVTVDDLEELRKAKEHAIMASARGRLHGYADGNPISAIGAVAFRKAMEEGAAWVDDLAAPRPLSSRGLAEVSWQIHDPAPDGLIAITAGPKGSMGSAPAPLLVAKLDQETRLMPLGGEIRLNASTALAAGLRDGDSISVTTTSGDVSGRLRLDNTVIPGLVELAASGPNRQAVLRTVNAGAAAAQVKRS